jgi:hypothetical protein
MDAELTEQPAVGAVRCACGGPGSNTRDGVKICDACWAAADDSGARESNAEGVRSSAGMGDWERRVNEASDYYLDALAEVDAAKETARVARKNWERVKREYEAAKSPISD